MAITLRKRITIAYVAVLTVIFFFAGGSIFLSKDILHNLYKIEEESRHIIMVNDIHKDSKRLILALHHFLLHPSKIYIDRSVQLLSRIESQTKEYKVIEDAEQYPEKNIEIEILNNILVELGNSKVINREFEEFSKTGSFDRNRFENSEAFAYAIEEYVGEINKIHIKKIAEWEEEGLRSMKNILFLFLSLLIFGIFTVYMGYRLLTRNIVKPIMLLASATSEFSKGAFDKRLSINSETEIGLLYQAFNDMAGRIEEHNQLLEEFNKELEKKVKEKTQKLVTLNEELTRTRDSLIKAERIAAIGEIATGVTHEIRNPLNSLYINAQMLLKEIQTKCGSDECRFIELVSLVKYEISRINSILNEFVKFAKLPEPRFFENDINETINEVAQVIYSRAEASKTTIDLSLSSDIPPFKFDAYQFKEVLMNLFVNALDAMPGGGTLDIRTGMVNKEVFIAVADTGEGISRNNFNKIFTPFFTTKKKGLGLGLSIAQKIVDAHNGVITCSSEIGKGTTFEIAVPMEREGSKS